MSDELKKGYHYLKRQEKLLKAQRKTKRDMIETLKRYLKRQEYLKRINLLRK